VHGYALKLSIDGGKQADNFHLVALAEQVKSPGTVLA
jgi:hypothetical protein